MTALKKMPTRGGRRKKRNGPARSTAVIVGVLLGGVLAVLQLEETLPRWSQVPESLFIMAHLVAVLLVTAALTDRVRTALLCGVIAAASQFLTLLGFFGYSYGIVVALNVVPFQSLRVLTYPPAGIIGGYIADRIGGVRGGKSPRRIGLLTGRS